VRRALPGVAFSLAIGVALLTAAETAIALQSRAMEEAHEDLGEILTIRARGEAYWWDIVYRDATPSRLLRTANEIHIPAGERVRLEIMPGEGAARIWVPRGVSDGPLPGWGRSVTLRADEPGVYRARSGDFWRRGRPRMDLMIVVRSPDAFARWREAQLSPAPPAGTRRAEGERIFMATGCAWCHAVRGTLAMGAAGPDLTRFGSRLTIAAGMVPNNDGQLGAFIADPQGVKPGTRMPPVPLQGPQLQALIEYLQGLR
jgi:cytochrome c oxidase subunit II